MIYEIVLLTAWLCGSALLTAGGFFLGRFFARKIEAFFDRRRRL
jgi:hypothetical protein